MKESINYKLMLILMIPITNNCNYHHTVSPPGEAHDGARSAGNAAASAGADPWCQSVPKRQKIRAVT